MADLYDDARGSTCARDGRERILFIDSDPILREFAVANLAGEGTWVDTAADPDVALAILEGGASDLLILDIETPAGGGLELLAKLRADERWRTLPVMVVAGRDDVRTVEQAYEAGATTFVLKPLNWRLLGHQLRFMRRTADSERAALASCAVASDRAARLAAAGAQFVADAVGRDPSLKAAALSFAKVADEPLTAPATAA